MRDYWMLEFSMHIARLIEMGFSYHEIALKAWGLENSSYAYSIAHGKGCGTQLAYERYLQLQDWMHDCEATGATLLYARQ